MTPKEIIETVMFGIFCLGTVWIMWRATIGRAEAAESQAKLAWERHGEKDAAYQKALDQRDQAEAKVKELATCCKGLEGHRTTLIHRITELEAKLDAVEIDNLGHSRALSMLRGLFGLPLDGTMYDEIWQKHLELMEADKLACADSAEQWPPDVMCRLLLPVPIKEMGAIATALGAIARKDGKDARMRQVGNVLEIFTVPNDQAHLRVGEGKL
jgi:hypothetical protein